MRRSLFREPRRRLKSNRRKNFPQQAKKVPKDAPLVRSPRKALHRRCRQGADPQHGETGRDLKASRPILRCSRRPASATTPPSARSHFFAFREPLFDHLVSTTEECDREG